MKYYKMKIKPFPDQIIVKPDEKDTILVSDTKSLCLHGTVIAIGVNVEQEGIVKVGDRIIYEFWGLKSPKVNGLDDGITDAEGKVHFIHKNSPFLLGFLYE